MLEEKSVVLSRMKYSSTNEEIAHYVKFKRANFEELEAHRITHDINPKLITNSFFKNINLYAYLINFNRHPVGYIQTFINPNFWYPNAALLDELYVSEDYRLKNIGSRAIAEYIDLAKKDRPNLDKMLMNIFCRNDASLLFYDKVGFKKSLNSAILSF